MNIDKLVETIKSDLEHIELESKKYIDTLSDNDLELLCHTLEGYREGRINFSNFITLEEMTKLKSIDKYIYLLQYIYL